MPTFKVVGKKKKSRGLTRKAVAAMIKYPPSEFATIKVPRDPALRQQVAAELAAGNLIGEKQQPALGRSLASQWRGRGDYSQLWNATAGLRSMAGSWARKGAEGSFRRNVGNFMGYTGIGDYHTVDNSLVGQGVASAGIPMFGPEQQNYRVSKAEFIQNIYAPTDPGSFQNLVLPLNPGLPQTFPWLSLVAPQFEEYEFEQLMFYWRPMVSDFNSTTGQVGEIVMATQYNPSEQSFTDISRAKNYMGAMSAKTSCSMNQGVECDPSRNSGAPGKYVRLGPLVGTNSDLKQYDQGNLNVMISGTPPAYSDQILGELWVTYTVTLRKPKLPDTSGSAILRDYFQSSLTSTAATATAPAVLTPLAALIAAPPLFGAQNRLDGTIKWTSAVDGLFTYLQVEYTFPDWFNGAAEIDVSFLGVNTVGSSGAAMANIRTDYGTFPTGQVKGLFDLGNVKTIPPGTASMAAQGSYPTSTGAVGGQQQISGITAGNFLCKIHVQVGENTSGTDNAIRFSTLYYETSLGAPSCAGWSVNVQEYNSAFNSTSSGQLLLVDEEGNSVLQPWVI